MKYLNTTGLQYFWNKIKQYINSIFINDNTIEYGIVISKSKNISYINPITNNLTGTSYLVTANILCNIIIEENLPFIENAYNVNTILYINDKLILELSKNIISGEFYTYDEVYDAIYHWANNAFEDYINGQFIIINQILGDDWTTDTPKQVGTIYKSNDINFNILITEPITIIQSMLINTQILYEGPDEYNNKILSYIKHLDLSKCDLSKTTNLSYAFLGMFYIEELHLESINFNNVNTSNVTDMSYMFNHLTKLTELDLNSFDTFNVTDMQSMFYDCLSLIKLDLSSFNTFNVTDMQSMFCNCYPLTELDLSSFNTFNVTNMQSMFKQCNLLTELNLGNFNTSKVTDMSDMFYNCYSLIKLDLSYFDTSNVTDMAHIFYNCRSLNYIKCTQKFKNWCITNQDIISLPTAMRNGGTGVWEIIN